MCGLVGIIDYSAQGLLDGDFSFFNQMLFVNMLRGKDSTGVMTVNTKGDLDWIKSADPSPEFIKSLEYERFVNRKKGNAAVFGHCRAATRGSVSPGNAHPFTVGNITLIKNGTLTSCYEVDKDFYKWDVDSAWAAYILNTMGAAAFSEKVKGGYAMIWHDARDNMIHIMRNDGRPLYRMQTKDQKFAQVWIASEPAFMTMVAERNGIKLHKLEFFSPNTEYSISLEKNEMFGTKHKPSPKEKPITLVGIPIPKLEDKTKSKQKKAEEIYSVSSGTGKKMMVGDYVTFTPHFEPIGIVKGATQYHKFKGSVMMLDNTKCEVYGGVSIDPELVNDVTGITAKISKISNFESGYKLNVKEPFFHLIGDQKSV